MKCKNMHFIIQLRNYQLSIKNWILKAIHIWHFLTKGFGNKPIAIVGTGNGQLEMFFLNETTGKYQVIFIHSLQFADVGMRVTLSLVDLVGDEDLFCR